MLKVKLLHPDARLPTVTYAGSDLGYDLYSIEDITLEPGRPAKVRTGIAVEGPTGYGFVLGDRSSMAAKGVTYAGGRIDAGYRGEILVCLINVNQPRWTLHCARTKEGFVSDVSLERSDVSVAIKKGDKIVQMSLFAAMTDLEVIAVQDLSDSDRDAKGFGSSGR
ncbi:Deoxyuridine 5'-triphosphate nucleotidohydrolase [Acidisarcina polymorpha]|uniref:dUTP diphosphatase n=1 Tax=Acidisarcina polymorpha TaxID=2211140 RepID=A0A2Z5FUQ6_9BACT|nr:dUTP diphosphatase [Acidisarcina polymorpha]AXC10480.1 Deoxyuridine 5'-triphosphate nucleotidohydrolase [Acidisarcina polymorpha]